MGEVRALPLFCKGYQEPTVTGKYVYGVCSIGLNPHFNVPSFFEQLSLKA
jgi:hypothetical protein